MSRRYIGIGRLPVLNSPGAWSGLGTKTFYETPGDIWFKNEIKC